MCFTVPKCIKTDSNSNSIEIACCSLTEIVALVQFIKGQIASGVDDQK